MMDLNIGFVVHDCCIHGCDVTWAVTTAYDKRRKADHRLFYCPNGHGQSYVGKTEQEKELDRLRTRLKWREESLEAARDLVKTHDYRARAYKGQLSRLRRRVERGQCPEETCHAEFTDLRDHVLEHHPELVEALTST